MSSNLKYECPKCHNILLYSNKLLHDLKCTTNNPLKFSFQNPISNSRYGNYTYDQILRTNSNLKKSPSADFFRKISIVNDDGTTTEIKKDKNMFGKEELLEIKYDPQGNIIGRKRAFGAKNNDNYQFQNLLNFSYDYTPTNYYLYEGNNIYVKTEPNIYNYDIPSQKNKTKYVYETWNNHPQYNGFNVSSFKNNISKTHVINLNKKNPYAAKVTKISDDNNDLNRYFGNSINNNYYKIDNFNNKNNIYNYNYYYNQIIPSQNIRQNKFATCRKFAKVKKLK